ncbi:50S ribosomal protein L29 [Candidatus Roizmanbacteria bacterium]|nr:MAG: 50S ribosomal protein L29 [Candidatus Roizmanbacteria bacterium]
MKKVTKEYINKTAEELKKEVESLHKEIARLEIERKAKPQKDSNMIFKMKKRLAVVLTLIRQKELGIQS